MLGSPGVVIRGNRLVRNSWNGVVVIESPDSQVVRNALDGNGNQGIEVNAGSDGVVVAGNRAAATRSPGSSSVRSAALASSATACRATRRRASSRST